MTCLRSFVGLAVTSIALLGLGCGAKPKRGQLPPLTAASWTLQLPVKDFGPATVALPLGATGPRPIVIVLHGAHDRAEWQCGSFRGVLGGAVFILCPQGMASSAAGVYGLGSYDDSAAELRAALAALKARFGAHVAPSPALLIGYAEGAAVAADLARQDPSFFARVALVNGNPAAMSPSAIKNFGERGGKRMLFFCNAADAECDAHGVERALLLTRAGAAGRSIQAEIGPYLDQRFTDALKVQVPWLIEGDARWGRAR